MQFVKTSRPYFFARVSNKSDCSSFRFVVKRKNVNASFLRDVAPNDSIFPTPRTNYETWTGGMAVSFVLRLSFI